MLTLETAQERVEAARAALSDALDRRAQIVRQLHAEGHTIYGLAKRLRVSQNAVRQILGL